MSTTYHLPTQRTPVTRAAALAHFTTWCLTHPTDRDLMHLTLRQPPTAEHAEHIFDVATARPAGRMCLAVLERSGLRVHHY